MGEDLADVGFEIAVVLRRGQLRLPALPADEKIALAVSLFHFAWEDLTQLPRQMVMAAAKSVLAQAKSGSLPFADLRSRLNIRYF